MAEESRRVESELARFCASYGVPLNSKPEYVAQNAVNALKDRALAGDANAAEGLAFIASITAKQLEDLANTRPALFENFVSGCSAWPVLFSLHPGRASQCRDLLRRLGVGTRSEIEASSRAGWHPKVEANRYALALRDTLTANAILVTQLETALRALRGNAEAKAKVKAILRNFPSWARECPKLPPLSKATASDWWKLGKQALQETFPDPQKVEPLRRLVVTKLREQRVEWKAGDWRSKIFDRIRKALITIVAKGAET
jgi:hypothetical protein